MPLDKCIRLVVVSGVVVWGWSAFAGEPVSRLGEVSMIAATDEQEYEVNDECWVSILIRNEHSEPLRLVKKPEVQAWMYYSNGERFKCMCDYNDAIPFVGPEEDTILIPAGDVFATRVKLHGYLEEPGRYFTRVTFRSPKSRVLSNMPLVRAASDTLWFTVRQRHN